MQLQLRVPAAPRAARAVIAAFAFTALSAAALPAAAAPELIVNGDFSQYTVNGAASNSSYIVTGGQTSGTSGATLTGWGNKGYTFVFQPNNVSSPGAVVNASTNTRLGLWGPGGADANSYSNNGLTSSPTGGAFVAQDGDYQQGVLYQTINNLAVGQTYNLSFYWAAAQQTGFSGATTEGWNVYWADNNYNVVTANSTGSVNTASHGFTPWRQQLYQLTATTTTMTLAFLATGGPNGTPPFSLLDGVSLVAAPEPATWAVLAVGLVGLSMVRFRRRSNAAA
ncbi:MAG: PEP-CTERM sorting domain-containing protein [Janthinobacterium lividum]